MAKKEQHLVEAELRIVEPQEPAGKFREVVHVADKQGRRCGDCGQLLIPDTKETLNGHQPYLPYAHVIVLDGDPYASWLTDRPISCKGRNVSATATNAK